jgi:alpha-tubulin suppressor-like RCC1 family protein
MERRNTTQTDNGRNRVNVLPPARIACGHAFTLAANDIGQLYAWGCNRNAKLALDTGPQPVWRPTIVQISTAIGNVNQVACGAEFSMAILQSPSDDRGEAGTLIGWGVNRYNQIGVEIGEDQVIEEIRVPHVINFNEKVLRVACGNDFSACISESGRLYTWGRNTFGNLGHGDTEQRNTPNIVTRLSEFAVIDVSCGAKHAMAVTSDFKVYSWGNGGNGRLGHGTNIGSASPLPIERLFNVNIMTVSCGESHSGAVAILGEVYTWGAGTYGRLGHGQEGDLYVPDVVSSIKGKRIYMLACGFRHNLALSTQGEVFAWGAGNYGVTGMTDLKEIQNILVPIQIKHLQGKKITQIAVGPWHSVAITSGGEVYSWGYHGHGRLGQGSDVREDQPFPRLLPMQYIYGITGGVRIIEKIAQVTGSKKISGGGAESLNSAWKIVQVTAGGQHSMALTQSGSIWVWGESRYSALGTGHNEDQLTPVLLKSLSHLIVSFIACGTQHSMAITNKGEVYTWGNGRQGQLGTGISGYCPTPKLVEILQNKGVFTGACGEDFSAVISEIGEVYTWGSNECGKLGLGHVSDQIFPRVIADLIDIKEVSAGVSHMAAVSQDGAVYTWGGGFNGKLGNDGNENCYSPTQIHSKTLRRYSKVSCGSYHTLLLDQAGVVYGCGRADLLCERFDVQVPKPVSLLEGRYYKYICASEEHSFVVSTEVETFVWGMNKHGKLGLPDDPKSSIPKRIELTTNLLMISSKLNHNIALTTSGDIYTWGCGNGGRLGNGDIKNLNQPKKLNTHWNVVSENDNFEREEDEANALDMLLSQLESGMNLSSFKDIMLVLKREDDECREEKLIQRQEQLNIEIQHVLHEVARCKDLEVESENVRSQIEGRILQRTYELGLPQRDYFKVYIPKLIAGRLPLYEEMIWILRQQPCYISRLIRTMRQLNTREINSFIKSVRLIYSNMNSSGSSTHMSRDSLLYLALCKEVVAGEIASSTRVEDLFTTSTSPTVQFITTFFTSEYGNDIFYKILKKPIKEFVDIIDIIGADNLILDPVAIARHNRSQRQGAIDTILKDNKARASFNDSVIYMTRGVSCFMNTLKGLPGLLPNSVKILLKHAYYNMVKKIWLNEYSVDNLKEKFVKVLNRLIVSQILVPAIMSPEVEGLTSEDVSNRLRSQLGMLCDILRRIVENTSLLGDHFANLNSFISNCHFELNETLNICIETEDSTEVDLVISTFLSHFDPVDTVIHYPINDLISVSVCLIKYRASTEINPRTDRLYKLLDEMGDIGSEVPRDPEELKVNLKMFNKFLYEDANVSVCTGCGVPMPHSLALPGSIQNSFIKKLEEGPDDDYVRSLEIVCRKIDKFSISSLDELQEKLKKIIEFVMLSYNMDYSLAAELRNASEKVLDMISRDFALDYLLMIISQRLRQRYNFRYYLRRITEGIQHIESSQSTYEDLLNNKLLDLKTCLDDITFFRTKLKPDEKEIKKMAYFKLEQLHEKNIKNKKIRELPPDVSHNIVGSIPMTLLEENEVIERMAYGFKRSGWKGLNLHYSHDKQRGWHFELIYRKGKTQDLIGQFDLSNERFIELKRTANSEAFFDVPQVATFRLGPFIIFLNSRIRQQIL